MSTSTKFFHGRTPSSPRSRRSILLLVPFVIGLTGFLSGLFSILHGYKRGNGEPGSVSVRWDRSGPVSAENGNGVGTGARKRHKVMGFVGIHTRFESVGRRRSGGKHGCHLIGKGINVWKKPQDWLSGSLLVEPVKNRRCQSSKREVEKYDDFMILDVEEGYSKLLYKTYEPLSEIFRTEYFLHAYGPIYSLSADVVASLVTPRNNSLQMFSNEDVIIGALMLAMNVECENNFALCEEECTPSSIAVWDVPKCPGLRHPEKKLLELHQMDSCSNSPTLEPED